MQTVLLVIHVLLALSLVGLVLVQRGKGADIGAAFGSGASSTVFGSRGSGSFLTRMTAIVATLFFVTSLTLAYMSGQQVERKSVTERVAPALPESEVPVFDDTAPAQDTGESPAAEDVPAIPDSVTPPPGSDKPEDK